MNELYPDAVEDLSPNVKKTKGHAVQIACFVETDHGGDQIT